MVALETSIVAHGLPAPRNLEAAVGCEAAVRAFGAVPATVAVLDGHLCIGLTATELERVAGGDAIKVSSRDLGPAIASRAVGATSVAGTVRAAGLAGIRFMATGGIGGVHRGAGQDVSADLEELARSRVAVFCAGPKIILDLGTTMERLESLAVPVIGYRCDEMPAFYAARSGLSLDHRFDDPGSLSAALAAAWDTGSAGIVVAVPPPEELPDAWELAEKALRDIGAVHGAEATPRLLARMAELTHGRSVDVNIKLVLHNAEVAAQTAASMFSRS